MMIEIATRADMSMIALGNYLSDVEIQHFLVASSASDIIYICTTT